MTPNMTAIQMAVLDIIKACVTELKTANPAVSVCNWMSLEISCFILECITPSNFYLMSKYVIPHDTSYQAFPGIGTACLSIHYMYTCTTARHRRGDCGKQHEQVLWPSHQDATGPCLEPACKLILEFASSAYKCACIKWLVYLLQGSKTKQLVFDLRMLRTLLLWVFWKFY